MWFGVQFGLQLAIGLLFTRCSEGLIYNPAPVSSSSENPPLPQYRFHYYVRDDHTGDFKSHEEHRSGDSVTGSYRVGEPNGDLREVNYVADVRNGFKADVNIHPGGSPVKPSTTLGPKKGPDGFANQRTGISAPYRQRKPLRGFNPIVVKSLSQFPQPQPQAQILPKSEPNIVSIPRQSSYDGSSQSRNISPEFTTPVITQKSVQVELTYQDDGVVEKNTEKILVSEKNPTLPSSSTSEPSSTVENKNFNLQSLTYLSTEAPTSKIPSTETTLNPVTASSSSSNGLYQQLDNSAIRSSIMEIVNQQKLDDKYPSSGQIYVTESTSASPTTPSTTESTPLTTTEAIRITNQVIAESDPYGKANLPQRPMRLIGLSPIYMDHSQLQSITENLTSPSHVPLLDQIINIQYATPTPLVSGPLMGGPAPFRNIPRYVSEFSDIPQQSNLIPSNLPSINSLPISAPIIPQPEQKQEAKPASSPLPPAPASLPLCNDCILSSNYVPYPLLRFPAPTASAQAQTANNNQKPCPTENNPYGPAYRPGFAYILMPSQIIKNNLQL